MRFAIFTHVEHQKLEGNYYAYSPYVREMNIWFRYVAEVEIVGPAPLPIAIGREGEFLLKDSYQHSQITFTKVPSFNLLNFTNAVKAAFRIPLIIIKIVGAMKRADHLHLRCPGNIGLLACICQIFFPHKSKTAKYAGNWDPKAKQPRSYKLQKWILTNTFLTRNMKVLVYGDWPEQSKNIFPFFTASFSENEIDKIEKKLSPPFKFLFVGNQVPGKRPLFAVKCVKFLNKKNIKAELHVYGDGEMMDGLKAQAGNESYIKLHGNQPLEVVKQAYKESHFLILSSKSEGWPKAVAEAMFFGCIPVATSVSCLPWMLNYGGRGILIPDGRVMRGKWKEDSQDVLEDTVDKIIELLEDPEEMKRMSLEAQEWSQNFTLEKFEEGIKGILERKKNHNLFTGKRMLL